MIHDGVIFCDNDRRLSIFQGHTNYQLYSRAAVPLMDSITLDLQGCDNRSRNDLCQHPMTFLCRNQIAICLNFHQFLQLIQFWSGFQTDQVLDFQVSSQLVCFHTHNFNMALFYNNHFKTHHFQIFPVHF